MRHERMSTPNISALVVSFFGFAGNLKATTDMQPTNNNAGMHMVIDHDLVEIHHVAPLVNLLLITTSLLMRVLSASTTNSLVSRMILSAASIAMDLIPLTYQRQ
ncbi:hypothetical protein AN2353V1_2819 [Citrobacter koseri]|nr:hypothetical protein AN2353V1_2819 [Citrobacter koseri]CAH6105599.1 hypothetical protein AN2353V1_2819 [Citrobacter koseri]